MTRGPCAFTKTIVTRLVEAVRASGEPIARVEYHAESGKIIVVTGTEKTLPPTDYERWKKGEGG